MANYPIQPRPDVGNTIDSIFNTYMESKRQKQATAMQGLQLAQQGIDPAGVNLEDPNSVASLFGPLIEQHKAKRLKESEANALSTREKELGLQKTQAEIAKLNKEASLVGQPKPGDRPASSEFTARGFADKARQADESLGQVESSGFNPASIMTGLRSMLPNVAQGSDLQVSEQSRRQFVNAILRRESGAAIPPEELKNYTKQYFPVPGDSDATRAQKAQARKLAIANLEAEASRVPSQVQAPKGTPTVGMVEDGYRFKGGNPADPNSWEPAS